VHGGTIEVGRLGSGSGSSDKYMSPVILKNPRLQRVISNQEQTGQARQQHDINGLSLHFGAK